MLPVATTLLAAVGLGPDLGTNIPKVAMSEVRAGVEIGCWAFTRRVCIAWDLGNSFEGEE